MKNTIQFLLLRSWSLWTAKEGEMEIMYKRGTDQRNVLTKINYYVNVFIYRFCCFYPSHFFRFFALQVHISLQATHGIRKFNFIQRKNFLFSLSTISSILRSFYYGSSREHRESCSTIIGSTISIFIIQIELHTWNVHCAFQPNNNHFITIFIP